MAQMIRKQIYIDADSEYFLKQRSQELGVTEAEIVRRALASEAERAASDQRLEALEYINGVPAIVTEHMQSQPIIAGVRYVNPFDPDFDLESL